jgi:MFS transporter, DHA2 family, multidrug resistance protein
MTESTAFMPPKHRNLLIVTVMLVAILEVLDSTIVNVALSNMKSTFGATTDQVTWVLTAYVVASAVMIPLTGLLNDNIGKKEYMMIAIGGFMFFSFACGLTQTLDEMIFCRIMQGLFGAALIPLSQSVMKTSFPPEKQAMAMAIWGMGVMTAPVLGPTLGGFIIEHTTWRWIFFMNGPLCMISFVLCWFVVPQTARIKRYIDFPGLILMVTGIASLQLFLDQGNSKDWFGSHFILIAMTLSIVTITGFFIRSFTTSNPLINLNIFKDRNFALSTLIFTLFCAALFSLLAMQPIMMQGLFGYSSFQAGMVMAPRGFSSIIAMALSPRLIRRYSPKYVAILGIFLCATGTYMMARWSLQADFHALMLPGVVQGLGMGFFMVPISAFSLSTIKNKDITEASGLFSYGRMLGTSVGISLLSTLISRETQINWSRLGAHVTHFNVNLRIWFNQQHLIPFSQPALQSIQGQVAKQASMIAYLDGFYLISLLLFSLIILMLFMKSVKLDPLKMGH